MWNQHSHSCLYCSVTQELKRRNKSLYISRDPAFARFQIAPPAVLIRKSSPRTAPGRLHYNQIAAKFVKLHTIVNNITCCCSRTVLDVLCRAAAEKIIDHRSKRPPSCKSASDDRPQVRRGFACLRRLLLHSCAGDRWSARTVVETGCRSEQSVRVILAYHQHTVHSSVHRIIVCRL